MRLIDADALKENLKLPEESGRMGELLGIVIDAVIEDAPTIEERNTGKWNRRKGMYEVGFKCSECNTFSISETPYCSFCGCRMVQEGEDNDG